MMRDALELACKFYGNPNLCKCDVRPTKLINFKSFEVLDQCKVVPTIRLYWVMAMLRLPMLLTHWYGR